MEAARRPRPGLRRRRPSSGGGAPGGPLPGDGGECARPWAELLRAGSADLSPDGELPPLPAFRGPEPGRVPERPASPEVFTVGARTFSWTPFPPAPRGGGGPGRSYRVLLGARGRSGSPSRSPQRRPGPEPLATPGVREQLREAAPTLRSCPMCAADFAPRYESAERSGVWSGVHLRSHPSEPRGQAAVSRRGLPQERGASSAPPGHGEPGGDWAPGPARLWVTKQFPVESLPPELPGGSDVENGQHVSVSGPAPDFLWLRDGVQGMGRTPGLPEANTILDGEGHGADGQANTIKPLAQKNKQSLPTRICRCYFSFRDMTFPLVVKCLGSSSLHRCYRNKASKTCCWGHSEDPTDGYRVDSTNGVKPCPLESCLLPCARVVCSDAREPRRRRRRAPTGHLTWRG